MGDGAYEQLGQDGELPNLGWPKTETQWSEVDHSTGQVSVDGPAHTEWNDHQGESDDWPKPDSNASETVDREKLKVIARALATDLEKYGYGDTSVEADKKYAGADGTLYPGGQSDIAAVSLDGAFGSWATPKSFEGDASKGMTEFQANYASFLETYSAAVAAIRKSAGDWDDAEEGQT